MTGGTLKARDLLSLKSPEGETLWAEKAAEIRLYSGARYTSVQEVSAGQICCVVGLSKALPGDGLGSEPGRPEQMLRPCYACRLVTPPGADLHYVLNCLETLEEIYPYTLKERFRMVNPSISQQELDTHTAWYEKAFLQYDNPYREAMLKRCGCGLTEEKREVQQKT